MDSSRDKKIKDYVNNNNYLHNIALILTTINTIIKLLPNISKKLKHFDFSKESTDLLETRWMFMKLNRHISTMNHKVEFNLSAFIVRMYVLRLYNKKHEKEISHFISKLEYLRKIYRYKNLPEMLAAQHIFFNV